MKQYLNLINEITTKGTHKYPARLNMPGTTSIFGHQFRHNLKDGFPILTTKKISWKWLVIELLWFLRGDVNIKFLDENGVTGMWHQDAYNYYCKIYKEIGSNKELLSFERFVTCIEVEDIEGWINDSTYKLGECGSQYGKLWRNWNGSGVDQILDLIRGIIKNPEGRRYIVTAWNPETLNDMALNACHVLFQFNCRKLTFEERYRIIEETESEVHYEGLHEDSHISAMLQLDEYNIPRYYLDCSMYQRSGDVFLGVPFNTASYALLTHIVAKLCNMVPGDLIHTFGDVHIYDNHKEQIELQLSRAPKKLPTLKLSDHFDEMNIDLILSSSENLTKFFELMNVSDFILEGYDPYPAIKADLSTGLKK
jgi:thymidylate synthase